MMLINLMEAHNNLSTATSKAAAQITAKKIFCPCVMGTTMLSSEISDLERKTPVRGFRYE